MNRVRAKGGYQQAGTALAEALEKPDAALVTGLPRQSKRRGAKGRTPGEMRLYSSCCPISAADLLDAQTLPGATDWRNSAEIVAARSPRDKGSIDALSKCRPTQGPYQARQSDGPWMRSGDSPPIRVVLRYYGSIRPLPSGPPCLTASFALHTAEGKGHKLESLLGNRLAAVLALAVRPLLQPL